MAQNALHFINYFLVPFPEISTSTHIFTVEFIICYLKGNAFISCRELNTDSISSWIPETARAVINGSGCSHHVEELCLIGGSHHHHIRKARHEGDIKGPTMCGPICPHQPCSVHCKSHRQLLQVHIVHHLENKRANLY